MNLKKTLIAATGAAALGGLSITSAQAQNVKVVNPDAVVIQTTSRYYNNPMHKCNSVRVSSGYAYLKDQPTLKSKTYRLAPRGELLSLVKSQSGYGYMKGGWWLVKSARNYRYWVHQSVVTCSK